MTLVTRVYKLDIPNKHATRTIQYTRHRNRHASQKNKNWSFHGIYISKTIPRSIKMTAASRSAKGSAQTQKRQHVSWHKVAAKNNSSGAAGSEPRRTCSSPSSPEHEILQQMASYTGNAEHRSRRRSSQSDRACTSRCREPRMSSREGTEMRNLSEGEGWRSGRGKHDGLWLSVPRVPALPPSSPLRPIT